MPDLDLELFEKSTPEWVTVRAVVLPAGPGWFARVEVQHRSEDTAPVVVAFEYGFITRGAAADWANERAHQLYKLLDGFHAAVAS